MNIKFDIKKGKYSFQMACPEKALCDTLYTKSPVGNMDELRELLVNEIGINMDNVVVFSLNSSFVNSMSSSKYFPFFISNLMFIFYTINFL